MEYKYAGGSVSVSRFIPECFGFDGRFYMKQSFIFTIWFGKFVDVIEDNRVSFDNVWVHCYEND